VVVLSMGGRKDGRRCEMDDGQLYSLNSYLDHIGKQLERIADVLEKIEGDTKAIAETYINK